jgi:hypothetical protein
MKNYLGLKALTTVFLAGTTATLAQVPAEDIIPIGRLQKAEAGNMFHVSVCYSLTLNIKADFKHLGDFPATGSDPGPAVPGVNHNYDDGYNRVDITGNNHGGFEGTWYWGYDHAGQISGDTVAMHSSSWGAGGHSGGNSDDPQHGVELVVGRELQRWKHCAWGIDGGLGFYDVTMDDHRPVVTGRTLVTDTYTLNGNVAPMPPYNGTYSGPGSIIGDTPTRTTSVDSTGAVIFGSRRFAARLFCFKVGPYLEFPLDERLTLALRGGLAVVNVTSDFSYNETTIISGVETTGSGHGSGSDILIGGYVTGTLSYALNDRFSVFAGAQFQDVGQYTQSLNGRQAVLDLGRATSVVLGLSCSY